MRLNRYDAAATVGVLAAGGVYGAHLASVSFLSGVRVAAGLVLVTGLAACTANGSRPEGFPTTGWYGRTAMAAGFTAMATGLLAVATGAAWALAVLAGVTGVMWVAATVRHALAPPAPPPAAPPPAATPTGPRELARR